MKTFEERFTAWVDGQLTGRDLTEFEKELAAHPAAAADKAEVRKLGQLLRAQPAPQLGNADFFNHQLMQRIAAETPRPDAPVTARPSFWSLPRLIFAGAACLLIAGAFFQALIPAGRMPEAKTDYYAEVIEVWPGDPSISASTISRPEDKITVVWLEGLDYIPATYALK